MNRTVEKMAGTTSLMSMLAATQFTGSPGRIMIARKKTELRDMLQQAVILSKGQV